MKSAPSPERSMLMGSFGTNDDLTLFSSSSRRDEPVGRAKGGSRMYINPKGMVVPDGDSSESVGYIVGLCWITIPIFHSEEYLLFCGS